MAQPMNSAERIEIADMPEPGTAVQDDTPVVQTSDNYFVTLDRFAWNVKARFLLTELIGAGVGAWFAASVIAFFAGFNAVQGRIIILQHAWWIILIPTLLSIPTDEILFLPINRFIKAYKKNTFDESLLSAAYIRAHNIPILHGIFMLCRFTVGSVIAAVAVSNPALIPPPPVTTYQVVNCVVIIIFAGFLSGVIAYLASERVFTRFIGDINLAVWKLSRTLIQHGGIIHVSIRRRMLFLLVPLFALTMLLISVYTFQEVSHLSRGMATTDFLGGMARRMIFMLTTSTIFAIFTIYLSGTNTVRPLNFAKETLQHVSKGDLTKRLIIDSQDEIRSVLFEIINTIKNLEQIVMQLSESIAKTHNLSRFLNVISTSVGEGAEIQKEAMSKAVSNIQLLSASANVVQGSIEEAGHSVSEISTSLENFVESIRLIGDMISSVRTEGETLSKRVEEGESKLNLMVSDMQKIQSSSERIREATELINEIADQTNLLALNASIEAARAGEHGKGFAVVADEVSKLADRSTQEVQQIEKLVEETSRNIAEGVRSVNDIKSLLTFFIYNVYHIVSKIDKISEERDKQAVNSEEIRRSVGNLIKMSRHIYDQSHDQVTNTAEMEKTIIDTQTLTNDNARNAVELSNLSQSLNNITRELSELISRFKLLKKIKTEES